MMKNKVLLKIFINTVVLFLLVLILAILNNNFGSSDYTSDDLNNAYIDASGWLEQNNHIIQSDHNSMLWWMLIQAAGMRSNEALNNVIKEYKANNHALPSSPWSYLITGKRDPYISFLSLVGLPDYNIHFIYGFSCSSSLANQDIIKIQNKTDFCWKHHPISPACITHQLMAFRFMQRTGCNDQEIVAGNIHVLSDYIETQSAYDFRVVDVYIQRLLMQFDSANADRINPRWIKRFLHQQNPDGGWGDFQPLIPVGGGKYFGFRGHGMGIQKLESSFHATAQGVWLLAMMLNQRVPN
jgi:hypothetical protein